MPHHMHAVCNILKSALQNPESAFFKLVVKHPEYAVPLSGESQISIKI